MAFQSTATVTWQSVRIQEDFRAHPRPCWECRRRCSAEATRWWRAQSRHSYVQPLHPGCPRKINIFPKYFKIFTDFFKIIRLLQSGVSGCETGFVKCFPIVPLAVGLRCCSSKQGELSENILQNLFFTTWHDTPDCILTRHPICKNMTVAYSDSLPTLYVVHGRAKPVLCAPNS